jgi:hypothetical protein
MKTFILIASICFNSECHNYVVDHSMSQTDCDLVYTDDYLQSVIDPLLDSLPKNAELITLECAEDKINTTINYYQL